MRIYNICDHLSISVVKHIQLQKMLGAETMTCFNRCGLPQFASPRVGLMIKPPNLQTMEHFISMADLVVVHTSISSTSLLEVNTRGRPLIWAAHDLNFGQYEKYYDRISAALVPSFGYKQRLDGNGFPVAVIHRKLASADWPKWEENRINCTIMSGVVDEKTSYRRYERASELLKGRLMIQSAQLPSMMAHKYLIMETVEPQEMLRRLGMFETAWCGCGTDVDNFDIIINNKFHEAIASGAVPLLYRSKEMSEFAERYGCGITFEKEYPLRSQLNECRKQILLRQSEHCLEAEIPTLRAILGTIGKHGKPTTS